MSYIQKMNVTIRYFIEQQALLRPRHRKYTECIFSQPIIRGAVLASCLLLASVPVHADIYRFVTVDGVETFTDAPSDKSATVIIKDRSTAAAKKQKSSKKQKTHDISLDEIVQKAVAASINPQSEQQKHFEPRLPPTGGTITSKVGMRIDPIDGTWRQHNGIDVAIPTGTPIKPVAPGVVVYSGTRSGYGNTVVVEHENGMITLYAHNSRLLVTTGQPVDISSVVALSGSTGRSTGPHLHFEAWQAGTNVTMAFYPNSGMTLPESTLVASNHRTPRFRSEILSDGSVLFTNLPQSTP
jgi:murein DD-endopeptidase MepM/ murein hydrolase activator NlpD